MIQIIIFDDKKSFIHLALGFISAFIPFPFKLLVLGGFLAYEIVEGIISRFRSFLFGCPLINDLLSDIVEFIVGCGLASFFKLF